jgi:hypothetical protein
VSESHGKFKIKLFPRFILILKQLIDILKNVQKNANDRRHRGTLRKTKAVIAQVFSVKKVISIPQIINKMKVPSNF